MVILEFIASVIVPLLTAIIGFFKERNLQNKKEKEYDASISINKQQQLFKNIVANGNHTQVNITANQTTKPIAITKQQQKEIETHSFQENTTALTRYLKISCFLIPFFCLVIAYFNMENNLILKSFILSTTVFCLVSLGIFIRYLYRFYRVIKQHRKYTFESTEKDSISKVLRTIQNTLFPILLMLTSFFIIKAIGSNHEYIDNFQSLSMTQLISLILLFPISMFVYYYLVQNIVFMNQYKWKYATVIFILACLALLACWNLEFPFIFWENYVKIGTLIENILLTHKK
ncbi:hypothetical protein ACRW9N_10770 [Listeria aquatica]|uniref:hypothetical protein n=1 Tax=Listeria aquatica TaxID=1494960 RepID=UPI003EF83261